MSIQETRAARRTGEQNGRQGWPGKRPNSRNSMAGAPARASLDFHENKASSVFI